MNIALIGYGKMGKMVEKIAVERGHCVVLTIDVDNLSDFTAENLQKSQLAIEFTNPHTAFDNIRRCIDCGVPVVSGSTGWYDRFDELKNFCSEKNGTMLCASNFSLGVNVLFELNRQLAKIMNRFDSYKVDIEETHHTQKLDAPSGTAITLAEGIIDNIQRVNNWKLGDDHCSETIPVTAIRKEDVPGTHKIRYSSDIDDIEIVHTAHNRKGLAVGAVMAAEFIYDKKGVFYMNDFLKFND